MIYSYMLYASMVILAVFFAFLAQKFKRANKRGKVEAHPVFFTFSILPLIFIMGFRDLSIGVDGYSYLNGFNIANSITLIEFYKTNVTEPGFYFLYRISYLLGDFQWLILIVSTITLYFFYKALSYEIDNINFPIAVFIFATTQYFYYFGIMRMGIAASIIAYSYRYILENKKKKYLLCVFIATLFHYSALFSLILLFLSKNKDNYYKKTNLLKILVIIPVSFISVKYLIYPLINASRYQGYIESSGQFNLGFITIVPLLVLFSLFFNKMYKVNENIKFYYLLFLIKFITEICAPILGIGRMVWYVNLCICFLFPAVIQLNKNKEIKLILLLITILYCLVYSYFSYFGSSFRGQFMIPYKNLFFEIEK